MAGSNLDTDPKSLDFETAMRDLEEIVERLEHGDLPLEESLKAFERGIMLTRNCQTALKEAEQKVEMRPGWRISTPARRRTTEEGRQSGRLCRPTAPPPGGGCCPGLLSLISAETAPFGALGRA
jgi:exodeoxyribonuclease VII small subunit